MSGDDIRCGNCACWTCTEEGFKREGIEFEDDMGICRNGPPVYQPNSSFSEYRPVSRSMLACSECVLKNNDDDEKIGGTD